MFLHEITAEEGRIEDDHHDPGTALLGAEDWISPTMEKRVISGGLQMPGDLAGITEAMKFEMAFNQGVNPIQPAYTDAYVSRRGPYSPTTQSQIARLDQLHEANLTQQIAMNVLRSMKS